MSKGVTMTGVAEQFKNWLDSNHYHRSCACFVTLVSSLVNHRLVLVTFDGTDWVHSWGSGALVTSKPAFNAPSHTSSSLGLFTFGYHPKAGDVMLDIGAGVGTEIKAFSDWVGPQGLVYAVEADPSAFSRLEKLIDLLQLQNVTALHLAIGATEGLARLTQDGADGLVNRVVADAESSTVAIPMASLDTLISDLGLEQIDYLKMNIEGAERQALIGFQERSATVKNWCISCHDFLDIPGTETMEFVVDWLQQRGMSTSRHPDVPDSPWVKFYVYAAQGD